MVRGEARLGFPSMPEIPLDTEPERFQRLTRRSQFLAAAKGKRYHAPAFTLQTVRSNSAGAASRSHPLGSEGRVSTEKVTATGFTSGRGCDTPPRIGITVTKKTGGAVARNRIRRRLREALRGLVPLPARRGHDYVIVARREALAIPFSLLKGSLASALVAIDSASASARSGKGRGRTATIRTPEDDPKAKRPLEDTTGKAPKA